MAYTWQQSNSFHHLPQSSCCPYYWASTKISWFSKPSCKKTWKQKIHLGHILFVKLTNVLWMSELKSWWNSLQKASYNLLDIPKKLPLHSSFIWFQSCVKEARRSKTSTFSPSIASSPWINCTLEFTFMFAPPGNNTLYITTLWFGHLTY